MNSSLKSRIPLRRRKVIKVSLRGIMFVSAVWGVLSVPVFGFLLEYFAPLSDEILQVRSSLMIFWLSLFFIALCWKMAYPYLYFLTYFYDADENSIVIRKGVISKREMTLPFSKITDVNVDQDLLDVLFGLYDVHISTPTPQSGAFAHIDGVDKVGAMKLKELILEKINKEQ